MFPNDYNGTSVIIAGGKSERFGEPKSLALLNNKSLIEYSIELSKKIAKKQLIVFGSKNHCKEFSIPSISDIYEGCGPLGGIYTALNFVKAGWIATIPCDTPFLSINIFKRLLNHKNGNKPIIACSKAGLEPLIGFWHTDSIEIIKNSLFNQEYKIIDTLNKQKFICVEFKEEISQKNFFNINTKIDLELFSHELTCHCRETV